MQRMHGFAQGYDLNGANAMYKTILDFVEQDFANT